MLREQDETPKSKDVGWGHERTVIGHRSPQPTRPRCSVGGAPTRWLLRTSCGVVASMGKRYGD